MASELPSWLRGAQTHNQGHNQTPHSGKLHIADGTVIYLKKASLNIKIQYSLYIQIRSAHDILLM